jgi:hypothetical protein
MITIPIYVFTVLCLFAILGIVFVVLLFFKEEE